MEVQFVLVRFVIVRFLLAYRNWVIKPWFPLQDNTTELSHLLSVFDYFFGQGVHENPTFSSPSIAEMAYATFEPSLEINPPRCFRL
jgi:hypothetical protein